MAFTLPKHELVKLREQLEQLAKSPGDSDLRAACSKRNHAIASLLANGEAFGGQVAKLIEAGDASRAAKLVNVLAESGALMRRLKFSKMF